MLGEGMFLSYQAAVSHLAPQRASKKYFFKLNEISKSNYLPFYANALETRLWRVFGENCLIGNSLIQYRGESAVLSDRMNIIHAVWLDDKDLNIIAQNGVFIAHNPNSNLRLDRGFMLNGGC